MERWCVLQYSEITFSSAVRLNHVTDPRRNHQHKPLPSLHLGVSSEVAHLRHPRVGSLNETGLDVDRRRFCGEIPAPPRQIHSRSQSYSPHSASRTSLHRILRGLPLKTAPADFYRKEGSGPLVSWRQGKTRCTRTAERGRGLDQPKRECRLEPNVTDETCSRRC